MIAAVLASGAAMHTASARDVPFSSPPDISSTASAPFGVFTADIDGDGDPDVLSASRSDNTVAWYENTNGDGSAWTPHAITTSAMGANAVFAADMDQDGDLDVLAASKDDDTVAWYENDGSGGTWTKHLITTSANGAYSVFAADVDGDGDVDALSASYLDSTVAWYANDGTGGTWTPHVITSAASTALSVVAADVNGDGRMDVLSASYSDNKIAWYDNTTGDGSTWSPHVISTSAAHANSVFTADLDGDGDLDALSASSADNKVAWYENTSGDGSTWSPHVISTSAARAKAVFAADVDADGDMDALSASRVDTKIAWYENTSGDGSTWTTHTITTGAGGAEFVFAADVDGDGDVDALSANSSANTVDWYRNDTIHRSGALPTEDLIQAWNYNGSNVVAADIDGDGDPDAVTQYEGSSSYMNGTINWFANDGTGQTWTFHTVAQSMNRPYDIFPADVDGDGDTDILSASKGNNLIAWHENLGGSFSYSVHTISNTANFANAVSAGDLDGDGDPDAISGSSGDQKIAWYANDGNGGGWTKQTITTNAQGIAAIDTADADGDGDLDVFAASGLGDKIAWYENDGSGGTWTLHEISMSAASAFSVQAVDMDGDGDADALVVPSINDVVWYENDGTGAGWTVHTIASGLTNVLDARAADVDEDGDLDVVCVDFEDEVYWFENQGSAVSWTAKAGPSITRGGKSIVLTDVDGDGDPDAIALTKNVNWLPNRGGQFALPTLNVAQKVASNSQVLPMLDVEADHRGRTGDTDEELVTFDIELTDDTDTPLTSAQANNLIASLDVYLDDGSGAFEAGADTLVTSVPTLSLTGGVQTILFNDGDPNVQLSFGTPRVYFVVATMTADAQSQTPSAFKMTHLTQNTSTGEDRPNNIPLILEYWPNTGTGVVDTALDTTTCKSAYALSLAERSVNNALTCEAGTILSAKNFQLISNADVTFRSGDTVTLQPGFEIQAGQFAIQIDPALKP